MTEQKQFLLAWQRPRKTREPRTCGMLGVVSEDADGPAVHAAEPGDDVLGVERHHLEKLALVDDTCFVVNVIKPFL